jgi:hypothetical protein
MSDPTGTVPVYGEEETGMRRGTHVSGSGTVPIGRRKCLNLSLR